MLRSVGQQRHAGNKFQYLLCSHSSDAERFVGAEPSAYSPPPGRMRTGTLMGALTVLKEFVFREEFRLRI